MGEHGTAIQWTHVPGYKGETWNPTTGCDRVSPGCAHCYALDLAAKLKGWGQERYQQDGDPKTSGPGFGLTLHPDKLEDPLRWRKPRAVFVNSMSDLFHEAIPDEFIIEVFNVMAQADQHIFMVLTKRPERMRDLFGGAAVCEHGWLTHNGDNPTSYGGTGLLLRDDAGWPAPNVWLGVTIENRRFVDRADLLRETPAAVRFISAEPLLGPLIAPWVEPEPLDERGMVWEDGHRGDQLDLTDIDWIITGGESGPGHRRFDPQWAIDIRDACHADDPTGCYCTEEDYFDLPEGCKGCHTAFLHKQNGGPRPDSNGRLLDGRTYDEFPAVAR
jgi:protein gp37